MLALRAVCSGIRNEGMSAICSQVLKHLGNPDGEEGCADRHRWLYWVQCQRLSSQMTQHRNAD